MTTTESTLAAELTAIRADLAELRWYVRTQPDHVTRSTVFAAGRLRGLRNWLGDVETIIASRIAHNLDVGVESILACPAALEGYLAGADWELAVLIGRLEQHERSDS